MLTEPRAIPTRTNSSPPCPERLVDSAGEEEKTKLSGLEKVCNIVADLPVFRILHTAIHAGTSKHARLIPQEQKKRRGIAQWIILAIQVFDEVGHLYQLLRSAHGANRQDCLRFARKLLHPDRWCRRTQDGWRRHARTHPRQSQVRLGISRRSGELLDPRRRCRLPHQIKGRDFARDGGRKRIAVHQGGSGIVVRLLVASRWQRGPDSSKRRGPLEHAATGPRGVVGISKQRRVHGHVKGACLLAPPPLSRERAACRWRGSCELNCVRRCFLYNF